MRLSNYVGLTITADTPTLLDVTGQLGDTAREEAINAYAAAYQTEIFEVDLSPDPSPSPMDWHCTALINGAVVLSDRSTRVRINWGDGSESMADEIGEAHAYAVPGSYTVTVVLERDGQPSLERDARAVAVQAGVSPFGAPEGTIEEVKAWVGDDPERAQVALDAELAGQNRSSLIAWLEGKL